MFRQTPPPACWPCRGDESQSRFPASCRSSLAKVASGQQTGSDHDDDDYNYHYYGDGYDGDEDCDDGDDGDDGDDAHALLLGTEVASNAWLEDESYMTVVPAVRGLAGGGDDEDDYHH